MLSMSVTLNFNSILVQLEGDVDSVCCHQHAGISIPYWCNQKMKLMPVQNYACVISIPYWCNQKRERSVNNCHLLFVFQFHIGAIRRKKSDVGISTMCRHFNSILVQLEVFSRRFSASLMQIFQFHIGAIRRRDYACIRFTDEKDFNSILVQLEEVEYLDINKALQHFNSILVQLEGMTR